MIGSAVILAAGKGIRLGKLGEEMPKGFLSFGYLPIIEESILKLLSFNIKKIFIGTGHHRQFYENLAKKYPEIECVFNPLFSSTNSMETLFQFKDKIHEDFILLESDLIYEKLALESLINDSRKNIILASSFTNSGDEVYIETNAKNCLVKMSKKKVELASIYGELVGISKITHELFVSTCGLYEQLRKHNLNLSYEDLLTAISHDRDIHILRKNGLVWCEIDDPVHLERAKTIIWPEVMLKDFNILPERKVLLNPGPATTTSKVKLAQLVDICPRENEFASVLDYIISELPKLVSQNEDYSSVLIGGSGTAAVEAMISSVASEGKVMVIENGIYGKRMSTICQTLGIDFYSYQSPIDSPIDLLTLEVLIQKGFKGAERFTHLAVVHHETTTGLLNDLESLGKLASNYGLEMMVDAVSSFAAIPIDVEKMKITWLASTANKNLQGLPGASFVIAHKNNFQKLQAKTRKSFYLDLFCEYEYFLKNKQTRFTPPVQVLYALKEAIIELKSEGVSNRYFRYQQCWQKLTEGMQNLGLKFLINPEINGKLITCFKSPQIAGYDFIRMHDFFYSKGVTIYPGRLLDQDTFRIANIGQIDSSDIEYFLELMNEYIQGLKNEKWPE